VSAWVGEGGKGKLMNVICAVAREEGGGYTLGQELIIMVVQRGPARSTNRLGDEATRRQREGGQQETKQASCVSRNL
jgi:hypothetical protein